MTAALRAAMMTAVILAPGAPEPVALDAAGIAMLHPGRAQLLQPDALIARLAVAPDAIVADVGAGPGWLTLPLARAVPRGRVIATDLRADYLRVAAARAVDERLNNVEVRTVARDDPGLAAASIDLAFLCQVDAYLPDRARYFARLRPALVGRGRLAVVTQARHRDAVVAAAQTAGFAAADEWAPSPPYVLLVFSRSP